MITSFPASVQFHVFVFYFNPLTPEFVYIIYNIFFFCVWHLGNANGISADCTTRTVCHIFATVGVKGSECGFLKVFFFLKRINFGVLKMFSF